MKYALPIVYRACALDEIMRLLQDELDLSTEDLDSIRDVYRDLRDPEASFNGDSRMCQFRDNLNIKPVQDNLCERMKVLEGKIYLLTHLIENITKTYFSVPDSELDDCPF